MTGLTTPDEEPATRTLRRRRLGGIFPRYLVVVVGLVGASLVTLAAISVYFTYVDTEAGVERLQRARIAGATASLEELTRDLRGQVEEIALTVGADDDPSPGTWKVRFEDVLARPSPFRQLAFVDRSLRERVRVPAGQAPTPATRVDRSGDRVVLTATLTGYSFGPVTAGSGFTLAVRTRPPRQEMIVAEVGLEPVTDRLALLHQSDPRYRYVVVDAEGRAVASSDSRVDPTALPYVTRALASSSPPDVQATPVESTDEAGRQVLTSSAVLEDSKWRVFIEELRSEAYAPVRSTIVRTAVLAGLFLLAIVLAAAAVTRRMTRPIRVLTAGAERMGAGGLDEPIALQGGGTELESLTDEFNRMSARLRESYNTLETRVADRTRDLTVSLAENSRLLDELETRTAQLEVANRHKSAFLAGTSHELRTPLNAIIGFSEVMKDGLVGEVTDRQAEYLQDINDAGRHLLALINDILDLSKVEAGRMELELGPVDLDETIGKATAMVRERAETGGVTVTQHVAPDVGVVVADERKLRQLVLNLVDNALRFTPPGGSVTVGVRRNLGWIEIAVSDTGVGIASEDQEAIFDAFRQIGNVGRGEGTGLGLSLCRGIARLHGGAITLESRPGHGSVFTVRIPARAAVPQVTA